MKTYCFFLMLLVAAPGISTAQDNEYPGMAGTEKPLFRQSSGTRKCFVFKAYVVKTDQPEEMGDDISIYKRPASISGSRACRTSGRPYLFIRDADNNSFFGISKNFLFVDAGTSVESRDLTVFNLATRRSILKEIYTENVKLVDGRHLVYDRPSDRKGSLRTCKDAAKWKRQGGGVAWVQAKRLDLLSMKKTNVGTLRCIYMQ